MCGRKEINDNQYLIKEEEFSVNKRYEACLNWYIKQACCYRLVYYVFTLLGAMCPILVAALSNISFSAEHEQTAKIILTVLSVFASFSAIILSTFRAQEKWLRYRSAAEVLKRERSLFLEGKKGSVEELEFLEVIEKYMEQENIDWMKIYKMKDQEKDVCDTNIT